MINIIETYKWPLVLMAALAAIMWAVFVAFGDKLGVSPEAQQDVRTGLSALWGFVLTVLAPLIARDKDGDGNPDIFQERK